MPAIRQNALKHWRNMGGPWQQVRLFLWAAGLADDGNIMTVVSQQSIHNEREGWLKHTQVGDFGNGVVGEE